MRLMFQHANPRVQARNTTSTGTKSASAQFNPDDYKRNTPLNLSRLVAPEAIIQYKVMA